MGTVRHRAALPLDRVNRAEAGCVEYSMSARRPDHGLVERLPRCSALRSIAFAAVGGLLIWHIMRRGRLIRERLSDPRVIHLPEFPAKEIDRES